MVRRGAGQESRKGAKPTPYWSVHLAYSWCRLPQAPILRHKVVPDRGYTASNGETACRATDIYEGIRVSRASAAVSLADTSTTSYRRPEETFFDNGKLDRAVRY